MTTTSPILQRLEAGTLIRQSWIGTDAQGRETACLLAALVPACGRQQSAGACPADVMPAWLAELTPWIDDAGTLAHWPAVVRRYADLASRWHILTPLAWRKLDYATRAICVREALPHVTVDDWGVRAACDLVLVLLDEAAETGDLPAEAAAEAAEAAGARARDAAAWAARAARAAAGAAAACAAGGPAAREAAGAAWAAAACAAGGPAARAAADRIIDATLDAIEREIEAT
jgi:hypothetical protein